MKDKERNIKTWHAIGREATRLVNALRKAMLDFCKKKKENTTLPHNHESDTANGVQCFCCYSTC